MALDIRRVIPDVCETQVLCVAYNSQRRELYTGTADSTIKVWQSETGDFIRTLQEHKGWVTGLYYCSHIRLLFSCSVDGKIKAWNAKWEVLATVDAGGPVYCLAWESRKNLLLAGMNGGLRIYNVSDDPLLLVHKSSAGNQRIIVAQPIIKTHKDLVRHIVCSDHGKIYSASYDGSFCIYDSENPRQKFTLFPNSHAGAISSLAFDNNNNWLITGSYDGSVKIWSQDGKPLQKFEGFSDAVTGLCYTPSTRALMVAASSPQPVLYDPRTGVNITEYVPSLAPRECGDVTFQTFFGFNETQEVIGITSGRHVVIWKHNPCSAKRIVQGHDDWVESLCLASISRTHHDSSNHSDNGIQKPALPAQKTVTAIYSAAADGTVRRWEISSQVTTDLYACVEVISTGHAGAVLCACFSEEMQALITGSDDSTIRVWTSANSAVQTDMSDKPKYIFKPPSARDIKDGKKDPNEQAGHTDRVVALVCVGHILVSTSWDMSVRYWDIMTGHLAHVIPKAHTEIIFSLDYSPERDELGTSSADKLGKIWDFDKGEPVLVLVGHFADVTQIKWNSKHQLWVTGSEDESLRTWDSQTGEPLGVIKCRGGGITAMCIDASTGYVLAASHDHKIRLFDPIAKEVLQIHAGHTDTVRCIVHIPEKQKFVSCAWDKTIRIWNAWGHPDFFLHGGADPNLAKQSPEGSDKGEDADAELPKPQSADSQDEDDRFQLPYAELHPPTKPKSLMKANLGFDKVIRKMAESAPKTEQGKALTDDELDEKKRNTRLALKLNDLESELRHDVQIGGTNLQARQVGSTKELRARRGRRAESRPKT